MKLLVEHRPTGRSRKEWVVLMPAHPKPLVVMRVESDELARAVVKQAGHEVGE